MPKVPVARTKSQKYCEVITREKPARVIQRRESPTLREILKEVDPGFCEDLSDVQNLYYFTLRNLDEWNKLDREIILDKLKTLRDLLVALFPNPPDFHEQWREYAVMFREHFQYVKMPRMDLKFVLSVFNED